MSEFNSPEGKHRALGSSEELRKQNYLVSSTLTPTHLTSWVAMTMPRANTVDSHQRAAEGEESHTPIRSQVSLASRGSKIRKPKDQCFLSLSSFFTNHYGTFFFSTGPGHGHHDAEAGPSPSEALPIPARGDPVCGHPGRTPQVPTRLWTNAATNSNISKPASSFSAHSPGLCLLEVKQDPEGETGSS